MPCSLVDVDRRFRDIFYCHRIRRSKNLKPHNSTTREIRFSRRQEWRKPSGIKRRSDDGSSTHLWNVEQLKTKLQGAPFLTYFLKTWPTFLDTGNQVTHHSLRIGWRYCDWSASRTGCIIHKEGTEQPTGFEAGREQETIIGTINCKCLYPVTYVSAERPVRTTKRVDQFTKGWACYRITTPNTAPSQEHMTVLSEDNSGSHEH
jgi:hypothetical protein